MGRYGEIWGDVVAAVALRRATNTEGQRTAMEVGSFGRCGEMWGDGAPVVAPRRAAHAAREAIEEGGRRTHDRRVPRRAPRAAEHALISLSPLGGHVGGGGARGGAWGRDGRVRVVELSRGALRQIVLDGEPSACLRQGVGRIQKGFRRGSEGLARNRKVFGRRGKRVPVSRSRRGRARRPRRIRRPRRAPSQ